METADFNKKCGLYSAILYICAELIKGSTYGTVIQTLHRPY